MSGFSRYVDVCHCGHDKATHFDEKHNCLGMRCDPECRMFIHRDDPDRAERVKQPEPPRTPTTDPYDIFTPIIPRFYP